MMMQNIIFGAIVSLVIYQLNKKYNWISLTDLQFGMLFIAIVIAMSVLDQYNHFMSKKNVDNIAKKKGLIDNEKHKEMVRTDDGKQEEECYGTPYKIIKTQYGDRGL